MSPLDRAQVRQETALALLDEAPPEARVFLCGAAVMGALMVEDLQAAAAMAEEAQVAEAADLINWALSSSAAAPQTPPPEAGAAGPEGSGCSGTGQSQPADPGPEAGAQRVEAPPAEDPPPPPAAEPAQAGPPAASEDPTPPAAMPCTAEAEAPPIKWTEERKAKLRDLYPTGASGDVMANAINLLPGEVATPAQCIAAAKNLGLRRDPKPAAVAAASSSLTRPHTLATQRAALPAEHPHKAEAVRLLEAGMSGREVADEMDLPLSDVANWAAEVRARRAAEKSRAA